MKSITLIVFYVIILCITARAQQQTPQLLKQPADWQFERFPLPPQFAPNIHYKGVEELRFSPGMFIKDSVDYFTYVFVAEMDNITSVSEDNIKNYLLDYYKGLCISTAKQRKLSIDTSQITVAINKEKDKSADIMYDAMLHIFGVFADGAPLNLNMQIKVMTDKRVSKTYLVFIASPLEETNAVWKKLKTIRDEFVIP